MVDNKNKMVMSDKKFKCKEIECYEDKINYEK